MPSRIVALIALLLLLTAGACAGGDGSSSGEASTTTTAGSDDGGRGEGMVECENPEGFAISRPEGWSVNDGEVVSACSQFHPEPFDVPDGTDERVAAITAYIDPVAFARAAMPREGQDEDRALTVVDGRQAVRLSYETSGDGFYPDATPITAYVVDVATEGATERTLFVNTIGTANFDYETNVAVLDRMAQTLRITDSEVETADDVVATYVGGGGGFVVVADTTGGEVCLRIPPNGEAVCTEEPDAGQVHTIALQDVHRRIHAGVTGGEVWRVDLVTVDDEEHSYLPVQIEGAPVGGYAFPDTLDAEFARLILRNIDGERIRVVEPGDA